MKNRGFGDSSEGRDNKKYSHSENFDQVKFAQQQALWQLMQQQQLQYQGSYMNQAGVGVPSPFPPLAPGLADQEARRKNPWWPF